MADSCEELSKELENGKEEATQLVYHLLNMAAAACLIPVVVDGVEFEVLVGRKGQHILREEDRRRSYGPSCV